MQKFFLVFVIVLFIFISMVNISLTQLILLNATMSQMDSLGF